MKSTNILSLFVLSSTMLSCSNNNTQIAENTFIHKEKIYKIIDNELREIGDLNASDIKKFEVLKPKQRDMGTSTLEFVKPGALTQLKTLYRGNYLYYSLKVTGLNDLRENYTPGALTIQFLDEYGFILHSTDVPVTELVKDINDQGKVEFFEYNGKTEMSTDISSAIKSFTVNASIQQRAKYGY